MEAPSAPQSPRRPRPSMPQSQESRFIGYLVLGFGLLAVAAVLILAFSGPGANLDVAAPDEKQVQTLAADLSATPSLQQAAPSKPAQARVPERTPPNTLVYKRQPGWSPEDIKGDWQAMIGKYTAVAQLDGSAYQIILASSDLQAARIYSSGTYIVTEDMITFTPQLHWNPPVSTPGVARGYEMLTRASFSMLGAFQQGRMLWQNVPQTEKRVYTSPTSPLFRSEPVDYVVWQKLKR